MKRTGVVLCLLVTVLTHGIAATDAREEFGRRRSAFLLQLDSSSAAVLRSAEPRVRSNDVTYRYRQESNLLYLTGINRPNIILLLAPAGVPIGDSLYRVLLFRAPDSEDSQGESAVGSDVKVLEAGKFAKVFGVLLPRVRTLYVSSPDLGFVNDWLNGKPMFLERDSRRQLEAKYPGLKTKNVGPLLAPLRRIKSPWDVERIKRAIACTGEGLKKAAGICAPGHWEYELQAAVEYEMYRHGAEYTAYPSIVGSGANSLILHYDDNRKKMERGEVVVMDVGAEVDAYAADITRTLPVSGKFSREQRRVYETILEAQQAAFATIKPGIPFADVEGAIQRVYERRGFGKYRRHGASHHLGVDVHDAGAMDTVKAGMVFTVEPGLYIPVGDTSVSAGYRGWGIRIEDDVLVTDTGCTVLSQQIPRTVKEIEGLMARRRTRMP